MKFTFNWLKDHLKTSLSIYEIADRLVNLGIEVEEIIDYNEKFKNFLVGFIIDAKKHPSADRLKVCDVDIGGRSTLQIVCGAPNARPGLCVAVALPGAVIPASGVQLKRETIRGVESQGMMCSTNELCIDDDGIDGIMELNKKLTCGKNLASAINMDDIIVDVSITPNRADCFCVRGIARDLAAIDAGKLRPLDVPDLNVTCDNNIHISLQTDNVNYFGTLTIEDVEGRTPPVIARRLKAIGQKLIHFPVDIANYVCMDIGQPLHVFDRGKLPKKIVIRESKQGEMIKTLDGKETMLPDGVTVVASENEPLSIAGIIGGESTACTKESKSILIEGAYFDKVAISKAGQAIGVSTESRTRFERGVDPESVELALRYAAHLISKDSSNCRVSWIISRGKLPRNRSLIELTFAKFNAITRLQQEDFRGSKELIERLGLQMKSYDPDWVMIEAPSWRHDIKIEEDVIEEILRIRGFENIMEVKLSKKSPITEVSVIDQISDSLVYSGYYETKTFSLMNIGIASVFTDDVGKLLAVRDSSVDFSYLRPTLVASHVKAIGLMQSRSQRDIRIFEVGRRFFRDKNGDKKGNGDKATEEEMIVATISEKTGEKHWRKKQVDISVFDIKEDLEKILNMLGIEARITNDGPEYYHSGRKGTYIFQRDTAIAYFGEIHPVIVRGMGLIGPIACFEIFIDRLPEIPAIRKMKHPIVVSQYQPTVRDFSFIVRKSVRASELLDSIKKLKIPEVKNISIFDVYESKELGNGNKAIAIEVTLQSDVRTLSDDDITNMSSRITNAVAMDHNGKLRDGKC
jgi:phenylalanyl-tRNA synthetase beta chain